MRLVKLEINGFKSFARKTEIEFEQGITAIVGPNGSGKSNIADAVRWVLGEQSARALRGAKMEDVIFNGTEQKKPLAYCEVSLTFDNADGKLNTDFSEVTVVVDSDVVEKAYDMAFVNFDWGVSVAMSLLSSVIVIALLVIVCKLISKKVFYYN